MSFNFKHALLAGTALISAVAMASTANAATHTFTGAAIWGTLGNGMVATPTAGDNVVMTTHALTIDTSETVVLTAGAITATTGDLVVNTTGDAGNLTFTIGSFSGTGASDITVDNLDASTTRSIDLTFTGAVAAGGNLIVQNTETGGSTSDVTMTVGGNTTITGTTAVSTDGTGQTDTTAVLDLNGSTNTFTDAVTVTGGADDATNTASLLISGATTTFTGGLTLTDGAVGAAILKLDGLTTAQTVAGTIAGDGDITVQNASGATFTGAVTAGTITIENGGAALNSSATFKNTTNAVVTLGGAGTGTNTITFDATTAGFTATGAIDGAAAGETNAVVYRNTSGAAKTIVQASAIGGGTGNVDTVTVSGTGTTLDSNAAITTTGAVTVGSGATLDAGAVITAAGGIANSGTLLLSGAVTHVADITGTGTLDVNATSTVNGAITQSAADIAAVTLTSAGTNAYDVDTTTFSAAGTLALAAANKTVTSNFTNTTDGQGAITIADGAVTTAFVGDVGASTDHSLASLTIAGAGANVATFTGDVFVDALVLDDADELRFIGTSAQTVSGTLDDGILTVGNGTAASDVTFNGALGGSTLASSTVAAGSTARFNANVATATHTNTGTTYVGSGAVLTAATHSDTGTYYLNVVDANGTLATADFGSLTDGGNDGTLTASRVNINVDGDIGTGAGVLLLTGINLGAATLADNSIQYTFVTANDGTDTDVTVTRTSADSLATGPNGGVATTLEALNASTDTEIAAIVDNLASAPSQEAFNEVLEAAGPTVDGGAVLGGFNASVQSLDVTNTRLASLRTGNETGMVAGETPSGLQGWFQGFGKLADQDRRDGVDGFEADTYGMAVGLDTANAISNGTLGVALSYANTDVDSRNATTTNSEIDSYQVSLYGDFDVAPQVYVAGNLGFAWNDIDQTRHNVGGVAGLTANADYDSNQYIAYVESGREMQLGQKTTLTPHVLAHYQHITIDDYSEDGAGGANLNVDSEDLNVFELGVGAELAWDLMAEDGAKVRPEINVGYRHDLVGDDVSTTSSFTGGGASFETQGLEAAQGTFNVGAGVTYAMDNNWSFTADYDYEAKSDYDAHSGYLRAGYKF